jgi:hypothetical protein
MKKVSLRDAKIFGLIGILLSFIGIILNFVVEKITLAKTQVIYINYNQKAHPQGIVMNGKIILGIVLRLWYNCIGFMFEQQELSSKKL